MSIKSKPATHKNSITQAGRIIYLNNKELIDAVQTSKTQGRMTDILAKMLQLLCSRYARKGKFVGYSYNDDMQSYAMLMLVRTWMSFDVEKSQNPFAFYTQCVHNSFIQYINREKRQQVIRDELLVEQGLNPSFNFLESGADHPILGIEDEQDFASMQSAAEILKRTVVDAPIERDEAGMVVDPSFDEEVLEFVISEDTESFEQPQ